MSSAPPGQRGFEVFSTRSQNKLQQRRGVDQWDPGNTLMQGALHNAVASKLPSLDLPRKRELGRRTIQMPFR